MSNESIALSPDEQRVLAFLLEQWGKRFRITTIGQAMAALGLAPRQEMRARLGRYLATNPGLSQSLGRWGPVPFILTEEEKLLARQVVDVFQRAGRYPRAQELAQAVRIAERQAEAGLHTLADLGLIRWQPDRPEAYSVAEDWRERAGELGFAFHTVTLESGERFNVP